MRKIYVPVVLVLLLTSLLSFGWFDHHLLEQGSKNLLQTTAMIDTSIQAGNWAGAENSYQGTEQQWEKLKKYWPMLVHHQEMDRIEESMAKLKSYLQNHNLGDAQAELYNLNHNILHIPEKEEFNLKNIF